MPLTAKGSEILSAMQSQYGSDKGKQVFYASRNKGTISRGDALDSACGMMNAMIGPLTPTGIDTACERMDKITAAAFR